MTVAGKIEEIISNIPEGQVFTFETLALPNEYWDRARMKLTRMVGKGVLRKAGNGRYYKPQKSVFGVLPPSQYEMMKDLLYKKGRVIGYLTYYSIWNDMLLTSQISGTTFIGSSVKRNPITRKSQKIKFFIQPNEITEDNVFLLQILDSLKFIHDIPDANINESIVKIADIISKRSEKELEELVRLSLKYPPRVKALLGAVLYNIGKTSLAKKLKDRLNPSTTYRLGINSKALPTIKDWNII